MKIKVLLFLLIVILLLTAGFYNLQKGEFAIVASSSLTDKSGSEEYFLGYSYKWNGFLLPEIHDIILVDSNNNIIPSLLSKRNEILYINRDNHIGIIEAVEKEYFSLVPFKDYKMKEPTLTIAIKANKLEAAIKEVDGIKMDYSILGIKKSKYLKVQLFK